MTGMRSIEDCLNQRPAQMVSMAPEMWQLLQRAYEGDAFADEFQRAWDNGVAFLEASEALRGRTPLNIEWKGSHRAPGDEVAPIDLRVDHVFLVSCKYQSRVMLNASPAHLFERLLQGGHGVRDLDWYAYVAGDMYQEVYESVRDLFNLHSMPSLVGDLRRVDRIELKALLGGRWPNALSDCYNRFVARVTSQSAQLWTERASTAKEREALFWRMLRMGSAPYFLLGSSLVEPLRIRVATPWDWRLRYRFLNMDISPQQGGQPRVGWRADIEDLNSRRRFEVHGHVEIRWSHGRFSGNPEAKIYLDTPHSEIPGYFPLV